MRDYRRLLTRAVLALVVAAWLATGCARDREEPPPVAPTPTATPQRPPAATQPPIDGTHRPLAEASNDLGFRLLNKLLEAQPRRSTFLSPLSIELALAMAYNGAGGTTAEAMAQTMGIAGKPLAEVNQGAAKLLRSLESRQESVDLSIANSLWGDKSISFLPEFIQANRDSYRAEVTALDLGSPAAAKQINRWVGEATRGRIREIVTPDDIQGVALVLVNALYFHGAWAKPFERSLTKDGPFHLASGKTKTMPMMERRDMIRYRETDEFQSVCLRYRGGALCMYLLLPKPGGSPGALLSGMSASRWEELRSGYQPEEGLLRLPRFKAATAKAMRLKDPLSALGMGAAFSSGADFSRMADMKTVPGGWLFLSEVLHKCEIEVNEEGTTASAATAAPAPPGAPAAPPKPFEMIVDRPFVFAIEDADTGALLFVGTIMEPE